MKDWLLILLGFLLVAAFVIPAWVQAQDFPPPTPIDQQRILAEVGLLQVKVSTLSDYISILQARIKELSEENAKLKAAAVTK